MQQRLDLQPPGQQLAQNVHNLHHRNGTIVVGRRIEGDGGGVTQSGNNWPQMGGTPRRVNSILLDFWRVKSTYIVFSFTTSVASPSLRV